jgi:hypothetical protein
MKAIPIAVGPDSVLYDAARRHDATRRRAFIACSGNGVLGVISAPGAAQVTNLRAVQTQTEFVRGCKSVTDFEFSGEI